MPYEPLSVNNFNVTYYIQQKPKQYKITADSEKSINDCIKTNKSMAAKKIFYEKRGKWNKSVPYIYKKINFF